MSAVCSPWSERQPLVPTSANGLQVGSLYRVRITSDHGQKDRYLDAQRNVNVRDEVSHFAYAHGSDAGLWQLDSGVTEGTYRLRLITTGEGWQSSPDDVSSEGWILAACRSKERDRRTETSTFVSLHAPASGVTSDWILEPRSESGLFRVRLASSQEEESGLFRVSRGAGDSSEGWYLDCQDDLRLRDRRDSNSGYVVIIKSHSVQDWIGEWSFQEEGLVSKLKFVVKPKIKQTMAQCVKTVTDRLQPLMNYKVLFTLTAFVFNYYTNLALEVYSAVMFFSDPTAFNLGVATIVILITAPMLCWCLLFANSLESITNLPWYLIHIMPLTAARRFGKMWFVWHEADTEAKAENEIRPKEPALPPILKWMPVCVAVFGSALSLLFKTYGILILTRDFVVAAESREEPELVGVVASILYSCVSIGKTITELSHYGESLGIGDMAFEIFCRAAEVLSRVGSVCFFGTVWEDYHSITAVLLFDFALQFLLLVLHPAARKLMRNGMSRTMLFFWTSLMVLCAPPSFIPQLGDLHAAYYAIRMVELCLMLALCEYRCGWMHELDSRGFRGCKGLQGCREVDVACEVANPFLRGAPFMSWLLVACMHVACVILVVIVVVVVFLRMRRLLQLSRLESYQEEPAMLVAQQDAEKEKHLIYGEVLYIKVSTGPNRFLATGTSKYAKFTIQFKAEWVLNGTERLRVDHFNEYKAHSKHYLQCAQWRVIRSGSSGEAASPTVRFGDIVKIRSETEDGRLLSGGRQRASKFALTRSFVEDLKEWPFAYSLEEHYEWRIVAMNSEGLPELQIRDGQGVSITDNFALQAMPRHLGSPELFLSAGRGPATAELRDEVWTVPLHSRPSLEDVPSENYWPSYTFRAQRGTDMKIDNSDMVQLKEALHTEALQRGKALAVAARNRDTMMTSFMMHSGVPLTVTDADGNTPLHHFIFEYARERDRLLQAGRTMSTRSEEDKEHEYIQVKYRQPPGLFQQMLYSGLPHFELGGFRLYTPLHVAALLGERELCDMLLKAGADINACDGEGWTCLHDAVLYNHRDMVKYLLNQTGINPDPESAGGVTPMMLVLWRARRGIDYEDDEMVRWLVAEGAKLPSGLQISPFLENVELPLLPEGKTLETKFFDPREDAVWRKRRCACCNQSLMGKFLALELERDIACCFLCARGCVSHHPRTMPRVRCVRCRTIRSIPFADDWGARHWHCPTCSKNEGRQIWADHERLEIGNIDCEGVIAEKIFRELDKDNNGTLSKQEFAVFLERFEGQVVPTIEDENDNPNYVFKSARADDLFASIDQNKNGAISLEEFLAFFPPAKATVL